MCLKKHKTCCSSLDHHFWSSWRITSISICITIITISTSFISFTKCFTSFSRFQPFHWSGFTGFPTFTLSCICPSFTSDKLSTSPCFSYQVPLQRVGSTHTLSTDPTWAATVNAEQSHFLFRSEMQKAVYAADISVLFFSAGANFWAILAILGHVWAIMGNFRSFLGYFFVLIFFGKICICAI